jgi:CrcB protein
MKDVLAVGFGGFFGCVARYLTGVLIIRLFDAPVFPYATLIVNVVGCFLIGLLGGLAEHTQLISPQMQLFLMLGVLGGFTTYSAFGYQTLTLAHEGRMLLAVLNVAAHIILGLSAVGLGESITKRI